MNAVKIVEAITHNADYSFEFDVTTGLIENDIISSIGTNLTQKCGLSVPCSFNEFISRAFGDKLGCRILSNSKIKSISNEYISECYLSGELRTEINIFYPETNSYYRNLFFLYENDNNGHIMAYVVSRKITEVEDAVFTSGGDKKNSQQQEYELFYKKMLDEQSSGILAYSYPGYQVIAANAVTLRMFGVDSINELQKNLASLIGNIYYPSPVTLIKLKELRTTDASVDYDCILNKGLDNEKTVIGKTRIVYSPQGRRLIYSTYVDASEMQALQTAVDNAESGNRAKADFLFNMSHDLRTPMNAIIGYSELIESHWDERDTARKYLSKLMDSSKFLMFLLNNAIELASLESGSVKIKESLGNALRFNDMLDAIIEKSLKERNIHFSRTVKVEHINVMCDSMKLRVVFLNILSNAIKYTPTGGSIDLELEEVPYDKEGYALFKTTISDTGIGISPEFLPHIFENFSREKNTSKSGVLGAGLGLPVAKNLLELMGGSISVESTVGKGTAVTVYIPHRIVEKDELLKLTKAHSSDDRKMIEGKRILLAEDNELNAEIAMMILTDIGFSCDLVTDGTEAVAAIEINPDNYYDLILMDIQMPIMDGYEATNLIRQLEGNKSKIPIVALSANALAEDIKMCFAAGMNGHIAKPIDISKLMDTLFSIFQ